MSSSKEPKTIWQRIVRWLYKEIIMPLSVALVIIVFLIQAFQIPSSSMENSLLVGDFLLGLKFYYGAEIPYTETKVPGITDPKRGDVLIFQYPGEPEYPDYDRERYSHLANLLILGNYYYDHKAPTGQSSFIKYVEGPKDFIKRCIAKSGDVVDFRAKKLYVNDTLESQLPSKGKWTSSVTTDPVRDNFGPVRIPAPGDDYKLDTLSVVELHQLRSLMVQENPQDKFELDLNLKVNGEFQNEYVFEKFRVPEKWASATLIASNHYEVNNTPEGSIRLYKNSFREFKEFSRTAFLPIDARYYPPSSFFRPVGYQYYFWPVLKMLEENVAHNNWKRSTILSDTTFILDSTSSLPPELKIEARILKNGQAISNYVVQQEVYFMAGDNRDNSSDSRYWGFLSRNNVKAKAFITYFSLDYSNMSLANPLSWLRLPFNIRWSKIGKLIHGI